MTKARPDAEYAALMLRVLLGLLFIAHLYWKFALLPGGLHTWWTGLVRSGYPPVVPGYVLSAELAGALFLIPGVCTRLIALYALPMMLGAAHFWLVRKGFYFTEVGRGAAAGLGSVAGCPGGGRRRQVGAGPIAVRVGRVWLARPAGFEPATSSLEGSCSIQLSYGRAPRRN